MEQETISKACFSFTSLVFISYFLRQFLHIALSNWSNSSIERCAKRDATNTFHKLYFLKLSNVSHKNFNVFSHSAYNLCSVSCITPRRFLFVELSAYKSLETEGQGELSPNNSSRWYIEVIEVVYTSSFQTFKNILHCSSLLHASFTRCPLEQRWFQNEPCC